MPRVLNFRIKNNLFGVSPIKIDRKKLYGWTKIVALDENGDECLMISTDDTGTLLIPKGGTGLGFVDQNGHWVERSELIAIKDDGSLAEKVASSFNEIIELDKKITASSFMDHSITAFYELPDNELASLIGKDIYTFEYTYLDSYETNPAFVLTSDSTPPQVFLLIGYLNEFEMLSLDQPGWIDSESDQEIDDIDDIDFSII